MHVSGMQTSLQGVAASKVIVSIGETNKNLKGMIKNIDAYGLLCVYGFMIGGFGLCYGVFVCCLRVCETGVTRSSGTSSVFAESMSSRSHGTEFGRCSEALLIFYN